MVLRPQVWTDFIEDLKGLKEDDNYKKAINGETQIECFNHWVKKSLKKIIIYIIIQECGLLVFGYLL